MAPTTIDVQCGGYAVKTDIYEGKENGPVLLSLIGRTSKRSKPRYQEFLPRLANELGITSIIFDYTGHGDSPFNIKERSASQHLQEVLTVFDWMKEKYPNRKTFVVGSSYGGFLATHLSQLRKFDLLILQAPAIYLPSDFNLTYEEEDDKKTFVFRRNQAELSRHPLLQNAKKFVGKVLLVAHKRDERIPKEVTDAYADAFGCQVVVEDVPHSLGQATQEEVSHYNQVVFDWIASNL
jgi:uncharacterized protein